MNADIHSLVGAYAVDAVDDVERARFEQHLLVCADCRAEVTSLRAASAELSHLDDTAPPARLRKDVMARIRATRPLPPPVEGAAAPDQAEPRAQESEDEPGRRRQRRAGRWLAAAAAVVVLGGGSAVAAWQPWNQPPQQVTVASRVLDAPDAKRSEKPLPIGGSATLVRSAEVGRAVLLTHELPAPPDGKVYELWLQTPAGDMEPAGLMSKHGQQTFVLKGDASAAVGAGITIEPAGGSPKPTSKPLALFAFS
jgi:hypothetical protein